MNPLTRLLRGTPPTTSEIRAAIAELQAREAEIEARIADIAPGSAITETGATRKRVELEGEPAELVALDQELLTLRAEKSALPGKHEALAARLRQAEADEAAASLPGYIKALPGALKRWQTAQAAADKAKTELHDALTEVVVARRAMAQVDMEAPGVALDVATQVMDALGLAKPESTLTYSSARANWFQRLGSPQAEMAAAEEAAQGRTEGDKWARDDGDGVDDRRQPEQSIWSRKAF